MRFYSVFPDFTVNGNFYMETYGCQMNVSDGEVITSILNAAGYSRVNTLQHATVALLVTCAIRDTAEEKIWRRLKFLRGAVSSPNQLKIGVLGCMAERLKEALIEGDRFGVGDKINATAADFVCGPDAYRDLPKLIRDAQTGIHGASLALSLEETYADISPVRKCISDSRSVIPSALVSVMRGCNNMCSYCIVPFVRGRERSRSLSSIVCEIRNLLEQGFKEIVLLGQNVNSYRDLSQFTPFPPTMQCSDKLAAGFRTIYKEKSGGLHFIDLLHQVSQIDANLRIRFSSPHPKDFNTQILQLIAERPNICSQLHLPAQSGSSLVLERMRRGYSREAYLNLVNTVKSIIPDAAISSDFISGFCDETEEDHQETLSLIKEVNYASGFCFPFSLREKTRAFHRLDDNIPSEVKSRRHLELRDALRLSGLSFNMKLVGSTQLVLVEGESRRSKNELCGRNDFNTKVIFPKFVQFPFERTSLIRAGDYVAVKIHSATSQSLRGTVTCFSNIAEFHESQKNKTSSQNIQST